MNIVLYLIIAMALYVLAGGIETTREYQECEITFVDHIRFGEVFDTTIKEWRIDVNRPKIMYSSNKLLTKEKMNAIGRKISRELDIPWQDIRGGE